VITPLLLTPALNAIHAKDLDQLTWGAVKYGKFLAAIIKFVVIAFVLFSIIKAVNKINKKEEATPAGPSSTDKLLMEIRDSLKK
jgi:large conductance mechanosensitive channel